MTIKFYTCANDPLKMRKTLANELVFNDIPRESVDMLNPVFMINAGVDMRQYNIMYIEDFARYYFCKFAPAYNNLTEVSGEVDVLLTYQAYLSRKRATISRSENLANAYLNDEQYKAMAYKNIVAKRFPNGLTNDSIILMTVG